MSANVTSPAITMDHESGEKKIAYVQFENVFSGSDGIFYRNQCKLDATNCELGIEISPSEVSKCQNPEPSKPKPARFPEIEIPDSEMNDSQISQIIEPPIEDLTDQKSSR